MVGSRPSNYTQGGGGGAYHNWEVRIVGYQFTDYFAGKPFAPGTMTSSEGKTIEKPHTLNICLKVRQEGGSQDTAITLKVHHDFNIWEVSDDGLTAECLDPKANLYKGSEWPMFSNSLIHPVDGGPGFPEDRLAEEGLNLEPIIGTRCQLVQVPNAANTKKYGQRLGKDGKMYDRTDLMVNAVREIPPLSAPTATKGNGKADPEFDSFAGATLLTILDQTEKKSIAKGKLNMRITKMFYGTDHLEPMLKRLTDSTFYPLVPGVRYDPISQIVSLSQ